MQKSDSFTDRKKNADAAKARLLEKFKARPAADDPAVLQRMAERERLSAEREERQAAKNAAKQEALKAKAEAERLLAETSERELAEKEAETKAAQKAQRDARYALRKARK
jgi:hypothetical protein